MPRTTLPAYVDDLAGSLTAAWSMLREGVSERTSAMHHPTIATLGLDGRPRARTVILRHVDAQARMIRFHADIRTDKVAELLNDPRIGAHFYDPSSKVQIRLEGHARVHQSDDVADAAWASSQRMSRACYATLPAPGTVISDGHAYQLCEPSEAGVAIGRPHFSAIEIKVESLDWLFLAHEGHRRAHYRYAPDGTLTAEWRVP